MARTQVVTYSFTCDVCGNEIPEADQANAAVEIAFGKATYRLDLCRKDKAGLEKAVGALEGFLSAGRKSSGRSATPAAAGRRLAGGKRRRGRTTARRDGDVGAIREWARANGYQVSGRGRIAQAVRDAYMAANG